MGAKPLMCFAVLLACQPGGETVSATFGGPMITSATAGVTTSTATGDSSSTSSTSSTGGAVTSTSTGGDDSAGATGSTTMVLDVGHEPDLMEPEPVGCQGKLDLLFVVSREVSMNKAQDALVTAFPDLYETLGEMYVDFDPHVMVVDADAEWGVPECDAKCKKNDPWGCEEYPCDYLPSVCDTILGAGAIFNAGFATANAECELTSGRRFMIGKTQPDPEETFSCLARVGALGKGWLGAAAAAALSPELRGPGGCNDGFLRDDALLVIVFLGRQDEPGDSPGDPAEWAQAILAAKHDDPKSVVILDIGSLSCIPEKDRICELAQTYFPYHHIASWTFLDYYSPFDALVELVEKACPPTAPG